MAHLVRWCNMMIYVAIKRWSSSSQTVKLPEGNPLKEGFRDV